MAHPGADEAERRGILRCCSAHSQRHEPMFHEKTANKQLLAFKTRMPRRFLPAIDVECMKMTSYSGNMSSTQGLERCTAKARIGQEPGRH